MSPSIWQLLIIGIIVILLFGRGRISEMMGDVGKGISSFKKGLSETEHDIKSEKSEAEETPKRLKGPGRASQQK